MGVSAKRSVLGILGVGLVAALLPLGSPASADVETVSGSAFAAFVNSSLLGPVLGPVPAGVSGTASQPTDTYNVGSSTSSPGLPGIISLGLLQASSNGGNVAGDNHLGFATSSASAANVQIGLSGSVLDASLISSTCTSNGDGSTGSSALIGSLGGVTLPTNPAPNTSVAPPAGVGSVILNEQIVANSPGSTSITVNAVHLTLLPTLPGGAVLDVILAQSTCSAVGPDVNIPTTTTSTTTTLPTTTTTSTTTTLPTTTTTSTTTTLPTTTTTTLPTTTTTSSSTTSTTVAANTCNGLPATIVGTPGNDRIFGTPGADVIVGLGGDDQIYGNGGNDTICGGDGTDVIWSGAGHTRGQGRDGGQSGNAWIDGGAGDDRIMGDGGNDMLFGGTGNDRLFGNAGSNQLDGGPGTDYCYSSNFGTATYQGCEVFPSGM